MSPFSGRGSLVARATPWALALQVFGVLAVPLAFCCCISMAAGGMSHHGSAASDETSESCHHHPASPVSSGGDHQNDQNDPGCPHLDQLVIVLSGLLGTTTTPHELVAALPVVGMVSQPTTQPRFGSLSVDVPPPRV